MSSLWDELKALYALPERPKPFVDRQGELASLRRWFARQDPILVLTGAAGIGKTTLANEFCWQVRGLGVEPIWLGDVRAVPDAFKQSVSGHDRQQSLSRLVEVITEMSDSPLLVLDDVSDVRTILTLTPPRGKGRLLVTTRDSQLSSLGETVTLGGLDDEASRALLMHLAPQLSTRDVARLIELVPAVPLAIMLTAKAIEHFGMDSAVQQLARQTPVAKGESDVPSKRTALRIARGDYNRGLECLGHGDYSAAVEALSRSTYSLVGLLGEESQDALSSKAALAEAHRRGGKPGQAAALLQEVLSIQVARTTDLEQAATTRVALASAYRDLGRHEEALSLLNAAIADLELVGGPEHPQVLRAASNLAVLNWESGFFEDAVRVQETVVSKSRMVLGEEHLDTLVARANLADMLAATGARGPAVDLYTSVLSDAMQVYGEDNPEVQRVAANLGATLYAEGNFEAAAVLEELVYERRQAILGVRHPDTLKAALGLAYTYRRMGDEEKALRLAQDAAIAYRRLMESQPEHFAEMFVEALSLAAVTAASSGLASVAVAAVEEGLAAFDRLDPEKKQRLWDHTKRSASYVQDLLRSEGKAREVEALGEAVAAVGELGKSLRED